MHTFRALCIAILFFLQMQVQAYASTSPELDRSSLFSRWYDAPELQFSPQEIAALKNYTIVLIPGFLSSVTIQLTPVGYFDAALSYLQHQLSLRPTQDVERLLIYSQSSASKNLELIAKTIASAAKPVLLIGHSKGALDAMIALQARPDLWPKVGGFITVQAPFYGSPLVDYISNSTLWRWAFRTMLTLTWGDMESFQEFSPEACQKRAFARSTHSFPFPLLTFASYLREGEEMSIPLLRPLHHTLQELGQKNDGLIPLGNQLLPEVPFIIYPGLDHTDGVVGWGERGKQERFIGALLKVFLGK
jgi:pimeloyl-ACP methyl ester carboxylesterase